MSQDWWTGWEAPGERAYWSSPTIAAGASSPFFLRPLCSSRLEQLFGTPRLHDLEAVARAFGHDAVSVSTLEELRRAIDKGLAGEGLSVVVAKVPSREDNVRLHDAWNDEVARRVERP